MLMLARVIRTIAMLVAAVIVAGILLVVLGANESNGIVSAVLDATRWLVGPFKSLFELDSVKAQTAVNWGIAAAVYAVIGALIAGLIARVAIAGRERRRDRRGFGFGRRRRPVA
jgi:hypothetical protein